MTKVLVVDDTPDMVTLMTKAVQMQGYATVVANNGMQAIEVARTERPDAILLDIMMPRMSGLEALKTLKSDEELHEIPIILVSAKSEDSDVIDGLEAGAHDYVTKPFKSAVLAARLRSALRMKESRDEVIQVNKQLQEEIDKRKRKEQELVQAQKLEAIGQLAAGIAHEINTPSQYIGDNIRFLSEAFTDINQIFEAFTGLLDAAKNHALTDQMIDEVEKVVQDADISYLVDETPKAIQQSLEGIDKVSRIVRAMKEFSHPGSVEKQPININRAIESTLIVSRNEWKYVADAVTDFDPDMPLIPCYPNEFNQAILNLIVNAAQAISEANAKQSQPQRGTISITTRYENECAEIRIQDTGTGIPEAIRSKIFDHFFTTKEVGKGTGQGLTIVHSVINDKHGGDISFETEVGKGTTFIIRLPAAKDSPPTTTNMPITTTEAPVQLEEVQS